jgi:hypothetical protein
MDLLYRVRESTHKRIPITQLIARAVREAYGTRVCTMDQELPKAA